MYASNVAGFMLKYQARQHFEEAIGMLGNYMRVVEFPSMLQGPSPMRSDPN